MVQSYRGLLIVLGALILFVLLGSSIGGMMGWGGMGPGMMGWGGMGPGMMGGYGPRDGAPGPGGWSGGLTMGLGWLVMLAFWGALIVGVVLLVRWLTGTTTAARGPTRESPLDILKRRYAAGEITQEEYARMRQELERS